MQRKNRNIIFFGYSFSSLAYAFIGIFYPILIHQVFQLKLYQTILMVAGYWFLYTLLLYPIHWIIQKHITISYRLFIGQILLACFFYCLHAPILEWWFFFITGLFFALSVIFYWGNLEWLMQKNTQPSKRGKFWGIIQAITIGVNIVVPFVSAYFLESDHSSFIFFIGISLYIFSALSFLILPESHKPVPKIFLVARTFSLAVFSEFCQHCITGVLYPLLVFISLGSLKVFAFLMSLMSVIELFTSLFWGHWTDKISASVLLPHASIARMIDILLRMILIFAPYLWVGGIISIIASLLGPLYQPAYMTKISEYIESSPDDFSLWIWRSFLSGLTRVIVLPIAAICVYFFGLYGLIIPFSIAGASLLFVKKL